MTLPKLVLHDYQETAVGKVVEDRKSLIEAPTGAGKSVTAVEAILRAGTSVNLVIGPLHTVTGWANTFARQGATPMRIIDRRKAGKQAHLDLAGGVPGNYFIGRELFRREGWRDIPVDFAVVDECQTFTNYRSESHKRLMGLKADYKIAMSATPAANKFEGLYAVTRWLWPEFTGSSIWKWMTKWCYTEPDPHSYVRAVGELVPGKYLASIPSFVRMPSIYKDTPNIYEIEVDLGAEQKRAYKQMERDSIAFLDANPLLAELPSTRYMRLLQMVLAVPTVTTAQDPETMEFKDTVTFEEGARSAKADALEDLLKDLGDTPVMVYTHSKVYATFLTLRLQKKGFNARRWIGGQSAEEKQWKLENFGKVFDIMVATIPAIGEGVDSLQHVCHTEVWMSVSDNRYLNVQCMGRLSRQGQKETVNRYVIRAKDTVELKQNDRIKVDTAILDASFKETTESEFEL